MRQWLMSVIGAALLCALALLLCPKGRVRGVTRLACGLLCALAMLLPLKKLEFSALWSALDSYTEDAEQVTEAAEKVSREEQRLYIQEQCRAYILEQAKTLGLSVSDAEVTAAWEEESGGWLLYDCTVEGSYSPALASLITENLGIEEEAQHWNG